MTTFRDALDAICMTATEAADIFGVEPQTIRQMRLDGAGSRTPPPGWEAKLATYARRKSKALAKLADELDAQR
jgi:hypothetical protein